MNYYNEDANTILCIGDEFSKGDLTIDERLKELPTVKRDYLKTLFEAMIEATEERV